MKLDKSKFNEKYYKEKRDRIHAGNTSYVNITDLQHSINLHELAKRIKGRWPSIRKVLVLGCGRGEMVKEFISIGVDCYGVDFSDYAVSHVVEGVEGRVIHGDICDLSMMGDDEYDFAVGIDIFNCIPAPKLYDALRESSRVAKMLVVDVPVNPDDSNPDMSSIHKNYDVSIYSQEWWLSLLTDLGMEYFMGQPYIYPDPITGSLWDDNLVHLVTMYFQKPWKPVTPETAPKINIVDGGKDLRIMWWSNAPFVGTGYGVGTEGIIYVLEDHYTTAVLCNYGLEGRAVRMGSQDRRYKTAPIMYPKLFEPAGGDAAQLVTQNWKPTVAVTLFDVWVGEGNNAYTNRPPGWIKQMLPYWVAYVPIDHDPIPFAVLNQCRQANRVVAMSRFGQLQLEANQVGSHYIPHGVYTDIFKPPIGGVKQPAKDNLMLRGVPMDMDRTVKWDNECFIIGINAANKDTQRKGYEQTFRALAHFLDNNPDAQKDTRMYIHTWSNFPGGMNLMPLAKCFEVDRFIRVSSPWYMYCGLSVEKMAEMYQGFDLFMNIARNEGFGIPIIEAAASGVPTIATNFTSMTELVQGHGWLVEPITYVTDLLMSNTAIPNHFEAAEYIEKAYNSSATLRDYSDKSRKFSLNYDWEKVVQPLWIDLFEDIRRELNVDKVVEKEDGEWLI